MIPKIIRFFLVLLGVLVLSFSLEPIYKKNFAKSLKSQRMNYSEVLDDFVVVQYQYDTVLLKSVQIGIDTKGKVYNNSELMDILPSKYIDQLVYENRFPDTLRGQYITPETLQEANGKQLILYSGGSSKTFDWMFESNTRKPLLELPQDMFRFTETRMEFVRTTRNRITTIDHEKSELFTEKIKATGLTFPVKEVYGEKAANRTKDYGFFLVDSKNEFYQVKMVDGLPVCVKIALPAGIKEFTGMNMLQDDVHFGYVYDQDMNIYLLRISDYKFIQLPIYDYKERDGIYFKFENYFFNMYQLYKSRDDIRMYVLDKDNNLVASIIEHPETYENSKVGQFENYLFPYRAQLAWGKLLFYKYDPARFMYLNIALAFVFAGMKLYRRRSFRSIFNWLDIGVVLVFGIYGFISAWLFPNRK